MMTWIGFWLAKLVVQLSIAIWIVGPHVAPLASPLLPPGAPVDSHPSQRQGVCGQISVFDGLFALKLRLSVVCSDLAASMTP